MTKKEAKTRERTPEQIREKNIVRTSFIGVGANLFLAAVKALIGVFSSSIAVLLDAVNNLSDALSSIITAIGTKLAGRAPDRKHPLGHGRIEYMTALVIAVIVLYAGGTSLVESIKKMITPEAPDYSVLSLVMIGLAVAVKILLGLYVKRVGKKENSSALVASGTDALFDAILSSSVLAAAIFFSITGISLEAYVGAVISLFIIKSGVGMIRETLNDILGSRTDRDLAIGIKETLCEDPLVHGAFDLFLYNYGPDKNYGSVHVEVDDTLTAGEIDALSRRLAEAVYCKHHVILTGISIYSINTTDPEAAEIRRRVYEEILTGDGVMQLHGFSVDTKEKTGRFDVVLSFECDREKTLREIYEKLSAMYPDYKFFVQPDTDVTD